MTQENEKKLPAFDDLAIEEPEREVAEEGGGGGYSGGSVTEQEEATTTISDFKALIQALNPRIKDARLNELLQTARVSRIFPDNFLDKSAVITAMMVLEQDPSKPFDFVGILNHTQDALSFGWEGRGIADLLEAFGAVKEQDVAKLSKDLFGESA